MKFILDRGSIRSKIDFDEAMLEDSFDARGILWSVSRSMISSFEMSTCRLMLLEVGGETIRLVWGWHWRSTRMFYFDLVENGLWDFVLQYPRAYLLLWNSWLLHTRRIRVGVQLQVRCRSTFLDTYCIEWQWQKLYCRPRRVKIWAF